MVQEDMLDEPLREALVTCIGWSRGEFQLTGEAEISHVLGHVTTEAQL